MIPRLYHDGPRKRLQDPNNIKAHLQWKGGPCVDTFCLCGASWHRCDTGFMYVLRCPKCDRAYYVDDSITLVEMTSEEKADLDAHRDETYKPRSNTYVPWCSMAEDEPGIIVDGQAGCYTCFSPYSECNCPCLKEQVEELNKEIYQLTKELSELKKQDPIDQNGLSHGSAGNNPRHPLDMD